MENKYVTREYLATKNAHIRDKDISFEEGPHIYTVKGDRGGYTSVTTWNHNHFADIDADAIINKMMKSKNWTNPSKKYYGMTREQIKKHGMTIEMLQLAQERKCIIT